MALNFPDVCKTPAPPAPFVPIPYPDIGMNMQAAPFSPFVQVGFVPATNMGSMKTMTSGDEAGAMGGLMSSVIKGPGKTTMGNPIILISGLPAESLANPTSGNMMNAPLGVQMVPSVINVLYTYRLQPLSQAVGGRGEVTAIPMRELGDVARGDASAADKFSADKRADGVVVVRLRLFTGQVDRELFNALRRLRSSDSRAGGVVLDLRGNRGGDARAALRLAEAWLPRGTVLLLERDADGDVEEIVARGETVYAGPLCVLIDEASASAAELVAATLQFHGRALIVGAKSYGKASAQSAVRWPDGRVRYTSVAEYLLPNGEAIDGRGVLPDMGPTADTHEMMTAARRLLGPALA